MADKSKPIEIISVDTEILEKSKTSPEAYAFYVKLSAEPDALWQGYLSKWRNALDSMHREINVLGDKLRLVFMYGDNIQSYVEYTRQLVKWVNERIEEHNKQVELRENKTMAEQEVSQKKEDEIRKKLREL